MTLVAWTDDRVAQLTRLWEAGLSAREIANELGNMTRNAVIGKVTRLGLGGRAKKPSAARRPRERVFRPRRPAVPAAAREIVEEPIYLDDHVPPPEQRRSLLELDDAVCHWPVGHPGEPDFHFCGGKAWGDGPYCAHHARLAYRPADDRRHRYNLKGSRW